MPAKQAGAAYQGHEVWWNSLRMHLKMLVHSVLWGVAFQVTAFLLVYLFIADIGELVSAVRTVFVNMVESIPFLAKIFAMFFPKLLDSSMEATVNAEYQLHLLRTVFLLSLPVMPIVTLAALEYFRRRGEALSRPEYIRGARMRTPKEIRRAIRKSGKPTDFVIGDVPIRIEDEIQHCIVIGRPRQGKTQMLNPIIARAKKRPGTRGLIFNFKGEFWGQFGEPDKGDKLFNPLDVRSLGWTVFNDIRRVTDIELFTNALIPPPPPNSDPVWVEGARDIFYSVLYYCYLHDRRTNKNVWQCISSSGLQLKTMFEQTPGCERGLKHLAEPESRQAAGFMTELMVYGKCFEYLGSPGGDGDFSVADWLDNGQGWLFVSSFADVRDALRPATRLFIEILIAKHLSMEEDVNRRIYYLLDEMSALGKLSVELALNQGAGKGCSVWIAIQAIGQLQAIYGKELTEAIISGCGTSVIFSVADSNSAKTLSDKIGDTEYWEKEVAMSYGVGDNRDGENFRKTKRCEKLFLPVELMHLKKFECVMTIPDYGVTRTTIKFKAFPMRQPAFVIKPEFDMETIAAEFRALREKTVQYRDRTPEEREEEREELGETALEDEGRRKDLELDIDQY